MPIEVINLSEQNTVFNTFIAEIRSEEIQQDRMRFRRNLERIGEVMAYEISKTFPFKEQPIITPLGETQENVHACEPVVASIMRAGLPLHNGILNYFDKAGNAFISAYRKHTKGDDFVVEVEYMSSPSVDKEIVILADPMLATGSSMVLSYQALLQRGKPKHVHIVTVIASNEGIDFVKQHMPANTTIWAGAIDAELTAQAYIVPGLGDAGDLAFGTKE